MTRSTDQAPASYTSKGLRISKSRQHKEMFLVTNIATNQGHAINTADEVMLRMHPVDDVPTRKKVTLTKNGRV